MSCRQNIERADVVGVRFVSARDAGEKRLRPAIILRYMAATRAPPVRVLRVYRDEKATAPCRLVFELATKLAPSLIQNGFVEAGLRPDIASRCACRALRRLRHVADLQVFDRNHCVVFADLVRCLVQEVVTGVCDVRVDALYACLRLFPVRRALDLTRHAPLILREPLFVLFESGERGDECAIRHGCETNHANVDTDSGTLRNRLLYLTARENGHVPLARAHRHGRRADLAEYHAAVAVADIAELRHKHAAVIVVQFDLLRVGVAEAVARALTHERREVRALLEEVDERPLKVFERLLLRVNRAALHPRRISAIPPFREPLAHASEADELLPCGVVLFLKRQRLVIDKPARARELAHLARCSPVGMSSNLKA